MGTSFHWIFKGKVQGVGFRSKTHFLAMKLQLKGFVRNLPSGEVEVLAQGERSALELLEKTLLNHFTCTIEEKRELELSPLYEDFLITRLHEE